MNYHRNKANELSRAVARIQAAVLALVLGTICGFCLFAMTAWLIIKGGQKVGLHLQLLSNYFIGYSVTWSGSIIGFFWGALIGGVIGWAIGHIYNRIVRFRFPQTEGEN
ncbi:MAG: hypothetical protein L0226_05275 [Acidobacteria bacterium]|nr:hypothetical protein [Acidobacteriota bacterium]